MVPRLQFSIRQMLGTMGYVAIVLGLLEMSRRGPNPFILGASAPIGTAISFLLRRSLRDRRREIDRSVLAGMALSTVTWAMLPFYLHLSPTDSLTPSLSPMPLMIQMIEGAIVGAYTGALGGAATLLVWLVLSAMLQSLPRSDERSRFSADCRRRWNRVRLLRAHPFPKQLARNIGYLLHAFRMKR